MKRFIYLGLLFSMLLLIVFPPAILAGDPTYTPYDYLDSAEKEYVNELRSWITVTKGRIDTAKTDLATVIVQDYNDWYADFMNNIQQVNAGVAEIKKLSAPESFSSVGSKCQALSTISTLFVGINLEPGAARLDIASAARIMSEYEGYLNSLVNKLNAIWTAIDNRINAIAKEEKAVADALSRFLQSCEKSAS